MTDEMRSKSSSSRDSMASSQVSLLSESQPMLDQTQREQEPHSGDDDDFSEFDFREPAEQTFYDDRTTVGGSQSDPDAQGGPQQRGPFDVALELAASILHPAPLLIPHAFELTGLVLGIPALFAVAALCWFSHGIYAVALRYTGGSTLNALAASVLPRAWGGQFTSEVLVDVGVLFVSLGRAAVLLSLIANLFASLARVVAPEVPFLHDKSWVMLGVGTIFAIPPFLFPHHKRQWSSRLVETLQTSSVLLYVFALFIILGRANHITWPSPSSPPPTSDSKLLPEGKEAMGLSPWGGISILIFCFSSHQSTFAFQRSLKPPKSLTLPSHHQRNALIRRGRRYSWELTAFSGMLSAACVCLGWGLVGYLAVPYPHRGAINIFNALPDQDRWFAVARLLTLTTMLCGLASIVRPASSATRRLMEWPLRVYRQQEEAYERRIRGAESSDDSDSDAVPTRDFLPVRTKRQRKRKIRLLKRTAVLSAWVIATTLALLFGHSNTKLASMVEVIGCIGSATQAFIVPALAFIVLFHIRRARSITGLFASQTASRTASDPFDDRDNSNGSPGSVDDMLFKKEQQLQRRLSGRRIWQDIGVFGLLVPVGFVVLFRGIFALASS